MDYPSNDKDLTLRYPFIRTFEWVPVRGYFYLGEEAELYSHFNHIEYEKTLQKARQKFGVYERSYGDMKYWNDPDYLFDWTEGEFM